MISYVTLFIYGYFKMAHISEQIFPTSEPGFIITMVILLHQLSQTSASQTKTTDSSFKEVFLLRRLGYDA